MNKNYYEILQVNKNASPEIIEKAYKTLVKMYHPDLQEGDLKHEYEDKLKQINEAFEVLSNEEKRRQYDLELEQEQLKQEQKAYQENTRNTSTNDYVIQPNNINVNMNKNKETSYQGEQNKRVKRYTSSIINQINDAVNRAYNKAYQDAYNDAYIQSLKNRGYRIRYKKTFNDRIKDFVTIIAVILILILLWHIPFIKNYSIKLYNENTAFRYIINFFINLINTIIEFFIH